MLRKLFFFLNFYFADTFKDVFLKTNSRPNATFFMVTLYQEVEVFAYLII